MEYDGLVDEGVEKEEAPTTNCLRRTLPSDGEEVDDEVEDGEKDVISRDCIDAMRSVMPLAIEEETLPAVEVTRGEIKASMALRRRWG